MSDRTAPPDDRSDGLPDDKAALRSSMRTLRRSLPDRDQRSVALWRHLTGLASLAVADQVLAYSSLPGEPDTAPLMAWCAATGRLSAVPESGIEPGWPDVVIVPGLAFTSDGDRLGQGGGWYDRFLAEIRRDCTTIGVCFAEQVVDSLPVERHDVAVDHVLTDAGIVR